MSGQPFGVRHESNKVPRRSRILTGEICRWSPINLFLPFEDDDHAHACEARFFLCLLGVTRLIVSTEVRAQSGDDAKQSFARLLSRPTDGNDRSPAARFYSPFVPDHHPKDCARGCPPATPMCSSRSYGPHHGYDWSRGWLVMGVALMPSLNRFSAASRCMSLMTVSHDRFSGEQFGRTRNPGNMWVSYQGSALRNDT